MNMMLTEVYDAFIAAGTPEDKARSAAQALSAESFATKGDIVRLEKEITAVQADIRLVKWMLGVVIAAVVLPLVRDFFV